MGGATSKAEQPGKVPVDILTHYLTCLDSADLLTGKLCASLLTLEVFYIDQFGSSICSDVGLQACRHAGKLDEGDLKLGFACVVTRGSANLRRV